ncbi:hypothetical protein TSAR_005168, partial [Trichomalopsis sarcophagae]
NNSYLDYFEALLHILSKHKTLYGANNVHNLLNIVGDARVFGCLDNFSAFRFENHVRNIKQLVKKGDKPLQQIHRRLGKIVACKDYLVEINDESFVLQKSYYNGPLLPRYASDKQF